MTLIKDYLVQSKFPYPYKAVTPVPEKKQIKFNGATFSTIFWPSISEPKGRVFIIHGFGEHSGLQHRLMDHLAFNGYESWTFDQRGFGETCKNEDKGKTNEFHVFNDLDYFIELNFQETQEKNIPLILFGHSMGGGITLNYGIRGTHRDKIAGYSVTGPLVLMHPKSEIFGEATMLGPVMANLLPDLQIVPALDIEGIVGDSEYKKFLSHDFPLTMPLIGTSRQLFDMVERGKPLYENPDQYVSKFIERPLLIMHGEKDTITDPMASKKFFGHLKITDKELKLYPGMVHSILSSETDKNFSDVFEDYKEWLDSRFLRKENIMA